MLHYVLKLKGEREKVNNEIVKKIYTYLHKKDLVSIVIKF